MTKHQAPEVTSELLPCPFCGSAPVATTFDDERGPSFYLSCDSCEPAPCVYVDAADKDAGITAWNIRATQPQSLTIDEGGETCARCGGNNPSWSAPSPLWNAVMRGGSINGDALYRDMVCIKCFMAIAEEKGLAHGWRLMATEVSAELETVTPSGRVWNERNWLWDDPAAASQDDDSKMLLYLLALIHGDAGQRVDEIGIQQAFAEAIVRAIALLDRLQSLSQPVGDETSIYASADNMDAEIERAAKALFEDWVAEDCNEEYCSWEQLPDKETWRRRARAALAAPKHEEVG